MQHLWRRFLGIWTTHDDVSSKFVRSSAIVVFERVVTKLLQFVRTIILARLLFPEDFGLFGLAAISLGLLEVFLQSGFNAALIREKGKVEEYLNVAWTVQVLRNFFVACLVFLTAPFFGDFFAHPEIVPLIRVLAVAFAIDGFVNIGVILFQKELAYNKRFVFDMSFLLAEIIVVTIAAYYIRSPWALVLGVLTNRIASVIFSYILHPYRPQFEFNWNKFQHLFSYGKWVSVMAIASFLLTQGDNLMIGKLLGAESLGYYQPAFALALIPIAEFGRVLGAVLFPMFSRIDQNQKSISGAFIPSLLIVTATVAPLSIGLHALAPDFVRVVYGERWIPMVPIISILSLYSLVRIFESVSSPLFLGIGKPHIQSVGMWIHLFVMLCALVPFISVWGLTGAAYAVFLGGVASLLYFISMMIMSAHIIWREVLTTLMPVLLSLLGMFVVTKFISHEVSLTPGYRLLFGVFFGATTYSLLLYLFDTLFGMNMRKSLLWILKRI